MPLTPETALALLTEAALDRLERQVMSLAEAREMSGAVRILRGELRQAREECEELREARDAAAKMRELAISAGLAAKARAEDLEAERDALAMQLGTQRAEVEMAGRLNRYSVGAEFFVNAGDESEARLLVGNFVDSFPEQVLGHDSDVILQDAEPVEEDVGSDV